MKPAIQPKLMRSIFILLFLSCCLKLSAQQSLATLNAASTDSAFSDCMENANRLLDEAFELMQKNYYRKDYINWDTLKVAAREKLQSRRNCTDAYETINWCFQQMRERHSFVMPTLRAAEYNNDKKRLAHAPALSKLMGPIYAEIPEPGIAYISIPWVSTTDDEICTRIADSLQNLIASLDEQGINNWIVDLRNNSGGNCWPMIAGAGPLLGEGICGYFIRNHEKVSISYKDGQAFQGKSLRCKISGSAYTLKNPKANVVVLTNNKTSSSGEIMALAFKGKERVQLYGQATAGFTTANATYTLSDNSMLVLTVCQEADRTGRICSGRIVPDVTVAEVGNEDNTRAAAIQWLMAQ